MIWKDMKDSASILMASLTTIFSILYSLNIEAFNSANEEMIIIFEIYSATFAFLIYVTERIGILKIKSKSCSALINSITAAFFLITIPHLLADSIEKSANHPLLLITSLLSPALIFLAALWLLYKELTNSNNLKAFLFAIVSTAAIITILTKSLILIYGEINLSP